MSAGNMTVQYLSDPAAQQPVMNSLFAAFAGFTAFGAAIVAVLTSGGAVQKVAERWAARAERKYPHDRWCWLIDPLMIVPLTALSCLAVLASGTGLLLSFSWLKAAGSGGWSWAYRYSVDLFEFAVVCITFVTFVAVVAAAATSVQKAIGSTRDLRLASPAAGRRRSSWATYGGILCGLSATAAIVLAFAHPLH